VLTYPFEESDRPPVLSVAESRHEFRVREEVDLDLEILSLLKRFVLLREETLAVADPSVRGPPVESRRRARRGEGRSVAYRLDDDVACDLVD
jgi:hypothetical protein